jgi:hypothetical protein
MPFLRSFSIALLLVLALSACSPEALPPAAEAAPIVPVLAASELTTGINRLPIGLLQSGTPLNDPELTLGVRLFSVDARDTPIAETSAVYRGQGLPVGLYVAYARIDQPGAYEAEISIPQAAGAPHVSRLRLDVAAESRAPAIGDQAIPSDTLTIADVPELGQLTSDPRPDADLYQLSIADAVAAGKPFLVTFSTPGYCQTAVCAPNLQVVKQLKAEHGDTINFIHVEVYPYPFGESFQARRLVPAMQEWNLRTEPWTYLVDSSGVIQARYEGGVTFAELEPALAQLAAGQPVDPLR